MDMTTALADLDARGVPHTVVRTGQANSAEESAELQGIPLGALLRTIVVRRGEDDYVLVLVPAGRRCDWPKLRAHLEVSRLSLPDADEAREATGYERYTITPFGAVQSWPVVLDESAMGHPQVSVGGGAFGVNIHIAPDDLARHFAADVLDVSDVSAPVGR